MNARPVLLLSCLLLSGCLGGPGKGPESAAESPDAPDGVAADGVPDGEGPLSGAGDPAAARLPEEWFLDYSGQEQACLEMEGRLLDARPGKRACWHMPGLVLDEPRTFVGATKADWPAATAVDGVLVLFGQSASPSALTVTLRSAGQELGSFEVDAVLLPFEETEVPFSFATAAPVAAGDDLGLEVAYRLPTATDYIVMGRSGFTLHPA